MYKEYSSIDGSKIFGVIKDGNLHIPFDEQNRDYQEYLKWLAEGNTPEPADEQ